MPQEKNGRGRLINIVTLLWDANDQSLPFSRCYDEQWVERLYDGFARNLTRPFRFVLFTDRPREIKRDLVQVFLETKDPSYAACIEPYRLGEPMVLVGLDTVVTGNIDHLADYCMTASTIALPADPFCPGRACNGVALVPPGRQSVFEAWRGENDMDWMRAQPHKLLDLLFPGDVVSYKGTARHYGLRDARIVYFHGAEKPHELVNTVPWIRQHWLGAAA